MSSTINSKRLSTSRGQSANKKHNFQRQFSGYKGDSKPSEETLKFKHHQLRSEIETAIKKANSLLDGNIDINELKQALINLNYLSVIKHSARVEMLNTKMANEVKSAS